jgi:hypothetical protein
MSSRPADTQVIVCSGTVRCAYELPHELDRRVIALIAAGEHELHERAIDPLQVHLRPELVDGVRCLRELATRRLANLYADGNDLMEGAFSIADDEMGL